jgi:hypothetical protein
MFSFSMQPCVNTGLEVPRDYTCALLFHFLVVPRHKASFERFFCQGFLTQLRNCHSVLIFEQNIVYSPAQSLNLALIIVIRFI